MGIAVKFHYGGRFVRDWVICYYGGEETLIKGLDPDKWCFFELTGILETDLLVKKPFRLWWMLDEEVSFRVMKDDATAEVVKDYALKKKSAVNLFVEHNVDESIVVVDIPNYDVVGEELGQRYQVVLIKANKQKDINELCGTNSRTKYSLCLTKRRYFDI